ncbi:MAG TPA: HEAT repeat domain-containing protein [Terriglobales bacterium]|nr:HEAT repeat domain-containing protein [Terriglobales bacterium]
MFAPIESLVPLVKWTLATVVTVNLLIGLFVFMRRLKRWRYFQLKEAIAEANLPLLCAVAEGQVSRTEALASWSKASSKEHIQALEELLLKAARQGCSNASDLLYSLGYVGHWAKAAFGRRRAKQLIDACLKQRGDTSLAPPASSFRARLSRLRLFSIPRAAAVANLGILRPDWALVFATAALKDPALDVRIGALDALGRSRHPKALPVLFEAAMKCLEAGCDLPPLAIKTALTRFQVEDLVHFLPFLTDPDRRVRVASAEAVALICRQAGPKAIAARNDLGELCVLTMEQLASDKMAKLRGLSAQILGQFQGEPVDAVLAASLRDREATVRLQAARACRGPHRFRQIPFLVQRLSDSAWEVREAAAQSLLAIGEDGKRQMYEHFVTSGDPYGCDEVADQIQRRGLAEELILELSVPGRESLANAVCRKMLFLGKTSALMHAAAAMEALPALQALALEAPVDEFLRVREATVPVFAR